MFILFISQQMNSAQPTRVACFAFRPSRNHIKMVTPISYKWKGKPIKRQKKSDVAVLKNLIAYSVIL